ncbi:hypothetical protein AB6A40_001152 [Gnathostoma spinigerum]|uniref:DUF7808 domain-containing protein n=1 Tax=Gnathostoma spinigerum TaxID=75299 RepID=A0ABD6ECB3_9BILA
MSRFVLPSIFVFIISCWAHPQFRTLECVTPNGEPKGGPVAATCSLLIKDTEHEAPGRRAPVGDGCYTDSKRGMVLCDLVCPKAHAVFHSTSLRHKSCFKFLTYGLEEINHETYFWRSGDCLNSTATFNVGCKFDAPFKTQFANDNEVFAKLKRRKSAA